MKSPDAPRRGPLKLANELLTGGLLLTLLVMSIGQAQKPEEVEVRALPMAVRDPVPPPIVVEDLTCFTCHSLDTFRDGDGAEAFPHEFHLDMLGIEGCHDCHAFDAHDVVITRLPDCDDCH